MTPDEARAELARPVDFAPCSLYTTCTGCGAMVHPNDQQQHRRAHHLAAVAAGADPDAVTP